MVLDDRHIAYLNEVKNDQVKLWRPFQGSHELRYVHREWGNPIDQTVASQMKALGLTRVVAGGKDSREPCIGLTDKGMRVLKEEHEAWLLAED